MRTALTILLLALATSAEARKIKPVREVIQVTEVDTRRVRIIAIYCRDTAESFDELWCHRVGRPFTRSTDMIR